MRVSRFIIGVVLLGFMALSGCTENEKKFQGKKLKLKLVGTVEAGTVIKFDQVTVKHKLPDTTKKYNPVQFRPENIVVEDNSKGLEFSMSPSHTVVPISNSGKWVKFSLNRGLIVSAWITCLALNQKISGDSTFKLDMPNYFSYEGILIIERNDGKELTVSCSKSLPIIVEVME